MPLEIIVCIKQTPHPEHFSKITLDPATGSIQRAGIPSIMNPLDKHAIEEGVRIREKFSGKVTAISMGPPQAREVLEEAYAMGADKGVLLCDPAFSGADSLATAYTLAHAIRKLETFDLILCGNESIDGATGQVGPQLADFLGIPHITYVKELEFRGEREAVAKREIEYGYLKVKVKLPALVTVLKGINEYRLPTVMSIMEAAGKEIETWDCQETGGETTCLGLEGSPTRVAGLVQLQTSRKREILKGSTEEVVQMAAKRLCEYGVI